MQSSLLIIIIYSLLGLVLLGLYKLWRVHLMAFQLDEKLNSIISDIPKLDEIKLELTYLYRQIQAYQDLIKLTEPRRPLPPLRGWAGSPDFLLQIAKHCLSTQPCVTVECSSGASTIILARCCELNKSGHVFSLEHDPVYAQLTRRMLNEHGLADWATVVDAPLSPQGNSDGQPWYVLDQLPIVPASCDLLVIDGPPGETSVQARFPALPRLMSFFSDSCMVFVDDANRSDEKEIIRRWLCQYPDFNVQYLDCEKGCAKLSRLMAT